MSGRGRGNSLAWLHTQINLALWAGGLALLLLGLIQFPAIYAAVARVQVQREQELQAIYAFYCERFGFRKPSFEFQRCMTDLAQLSQTIQLRTDDVDF